MTKIPAILFGIFFGITLASAQNYTLSGYIQDAETGEKLIGANIYNKANLKGTT